jgi:serine protease SohB
LEFIYEYGLFLAKSITIIATIIIIGIFLIAASSKDSKEGSGNLKIENISKQINRQLSYLKRSVLSKERQKRFDNTRKKESKENKAHAKKNPLEKYNTKPKLFIVKFNGDVHASQASSLREEITAILSIAEKNDEVLIDLESPGGVVHGYGLAATQITRLRTANINVTVSVDKVAASGGYMMACVANKIISAPFAIVGSIGVVAEIPNINKLLKKCHIDIEQHTAGDFKRTLTTMGENTEDGRKKFKEELVETHNLFKEWINEYRPDLNIEKVATGEHWYGKQAMELGLVDEIGTSDDFIINQAENFEIFKVEYEVKKSIAEKFGIAATASVSSMYNKLQSQSFLHHK